MTAASTLIFGSDEMVDAAACKAASLGANTVIPFAPSSAVINVTEEFPLPPLLTVELGAEELVEDEMGSPDKIVPSIVRF